jgi:lipid II:glycine glycyltransferase (peptidoglycan interpeptide bridge formation enzyme)
MKEEVSLKYCFKETLDSKIKDKVLNFLKKNEAASIEQDPDWYRIKNSQKKSIHFYALQNEEIVCYCNVTENKIIAQIYFGPVFSETKTLVSSLEAIRNYYLRKGFAQLEVQLGIETNGNSDEIEYSLFNKLPFIQKFDTSNWSTISIRLDSEIEEIFKSFKNNHRGSIKKAIKGGLIVKVINTSEEIKKLAEIYDKMYLARNLINNLHNTLEVFDKFYKLFLERNNGQFLGVFNSNDIMIGGIVVVIHNNEMCYKYGTTDPEFRKLPILHLALFEAIKLAKTKGLKSFDFGGYNHFVKEGDQVYAINFFKRSFGGEYIFYPKKMYFRLNKMKLIVFNLLRFFYRKFNSFRK